MTNNTEVLVEVKNLNKKFSKNLRKSLITGVRKIIGLIFLKNFKLNLKEDEFWALQDISFTLKRGECLGLIGSNGSGKSTLLKILNNIIQHDGGQLKINGRVGAIIELGAGFNPLLSGRENVYNNAAILGFTKVQIDDLFDSIVDFAELHDFIDMPLQNYSSGMKVRLGFAVASKIKPDILIIDEVLAVGDASFRAKCYDAIYQLIQNTAIIFVSHNMAQISRICNRIMLLDRGKLMFFGNTTAGINYYQELNGNFFEREIIGRVKLVKSEINNIEETGNITFLSDIRLTLVFMSKELIVNPCVNIHIIDLDHNYVYQVNNCRDRLHLKDICIGENEITVQLLKLQLNPGKYAFSIALRCSRDLKFYSWYHGICPFRLSGDFLGVSAYQGDAEWLNKIN